MPNILRERAHRIERWISEMSRSIQGSIDNEKQYLDKTKSKETLDQWFYFYERKLNTCDTIVSLLRNKNFEISQDDAKKFLSIVTSKLGIGGSHKMIKEYDSVNKVFSFSGDKRDEIKDILVNEYDKDEEFIKYHG